MINEEKVMKEILYDMKFKVSPRNDKNKIRRRFSICGKCKKNKVENHHFFCNSCWNKIHSIKMKGGKEIVKKN